MNSGFHILLDLNGSELQRDILQVISAMKLPNSVVSFHASPSKGYFVPMPSNLLIFFPEVSRKGIDYYTERHRILYPDTKFIYLANNFYFHEKLEVLELPSEKYLKYLTRCLMNEYLEFNKQRITKLIKESFNNSKSA
ncbi:MAG: hypothetical protein NE327_16790 [Lentisphaeraceae bacterium]|nr:hypothetical protein [Lentisphaeraceae bacterium]